MDATTFIQEYANATNEIINIRVKSPSNNLTKEKVSVLESKKGKLLQDFSEQCARDGFPLIFTEATISLFQANYNLEMMLKLIEEEEDANDSLRIEAIEYVKHISMLGMNPDLNYTKIMDKLEAFALPEATDNEKIRLLYYCINMFSWSLKDLIDIQQMIIKRMNIYKEALVEKRC